MSKMESQNVCCEGKGVGYLLKFNKSSTLKLTKWRVLREALNTHGLARNHIDNGSISRLEGFGVVLQLLARAAINLFLELCELAGDVSCVTVQHRSIARTDLARVIKDDHLQSKGTTWTLYLCGIILMFHFYK